MKPLHILILLLSVLPSGAPARADGGGEGASRSLSLAEAVELARTRSVDAAVAANTMRTSYWEYRTYRADLLPAVSFKATLPAFNKRYNSYQNPDGSYSFIRDDNLMLSGALTVEQRIWLTGGTVSLTSSLDFVRQLGDGAMNRVMAIPVALRLSQPLFAANDVKWSRRIEPVRYREAQARYLVDTENVALQTISLFFDLLSARAACESARQNVANAEKLYETAVVKRSMGRISENDVMQIELNLLNSRSELTAGESSVRACMFSLRSYLDLPDTDDILPLTPDSVALPEIRYADALERATANNPLALNMRRRQLEADYEVAKARGAMREVNLFAQIGYTGAADNPGRAYTDLRANQVVEVGVSLPLLDWGRRKGKVEVARSRSNLTRDRLRKERDDFNQNLYILVERLNNQRLQLRLATRASEIAAKRYSSSVETFLIGRISALDLNDAQKNKDEAVAKLIDETFRFWYYYYQLRSLTLYDFITGTDLAENAADDRFIGKFR